MDEAIEAEIQAKGLTAPRVTLASIEAQIAREYYFTAGDGVHGAALADGIEHTHYESTLDLHTICVLIMHNGFTVTGESVCVDPANYDVGVGRKCARNAAISKMWPVLGYELCNTTGAKRLKE